MTQYIKAILTASLLLCTLISSTSKADDTELYVLDYTSQAGVQPRVLIIFDDSGSMSSDVYRKDPFTGSASYEKVFWSSNGSVPKLTSSSYFYAAKNNCNASLNALNTVGFYTDVIRQWRSSKWQSPTKGYQEYIVDCKSDLDNLSIANPGTNATGFPTDTNGPYTTNSAKKSTAFSTTAITLYSEAYVDWYYSKGTSIGSRLQVAKDTIKNLITSTPNVDYGLATLNQNDNDGTPYDGSDDGGRIIAAIKNSNDTADTTDTNESIRLALKNKVDSLTASTWTPLSETMYEVAHYWQGGNVWKGKWSGTPAYDASAMLSGLTQYKTPFDSCHNHGYVILITDGAPTHDTGANSRITSEYINSIKLTDAELNGWGKSMSYASGYNSLTSYLPSLAGYMKHKDLNSTLVGDQTVTTYTIGFGDDALANAQDLLEATATQGGGKYFPAVDADALGQALQEIVIDILNQQYSMLAPATATSTSDHSQYLENLYYSLFLPDDGPGWKGNLKKLKYSNALGYIVDQNNNAAITSSGRIVNNAKTFWSSEVDGDGIAKGGVQAMLSKKATRTIYTNQNNTLLPLNKTNLTTIAGSESQLITDLGIADSAALDNHINWILGKDVDGTNATSGLVNREAILGDMMHSKPLVINYGVLSGTEPDLRIITGTNAGFIHMFKDSGSTVDESWSFIPYPLLSNQITLRTDSTSTPHLYGIDGTAVSYVVDKNNDKNIKYSDNDIAWVFVGQRQGGRSYYALDVSNPDNPSLKWIITGGATSGFSRLGQSWSTPQVTKVPGYSDPVVIFGGGYDTNKDSSGIGSTDSVGNAIYIVDAKTGGSEFKFVISPDSCNPAGTCLQKTDMTDSIPGGIAILDSDGDGVTDRLYAADTGGNIWRADLVSTDKTKWSMFKFASLGSEVTADQDRRFFYTPSIVRTINKKVTKVDSTYTYAEVPFDGVLLGSGNRNKPSSDKTVKNAYFMLRDYKITPYAVSSTKPSAIAVSDLYDISSNPIGTATTESAQEEILANLTNAKGWVYWLSGTGEKVFGSGTVINGDLSFSSFYPEASQSLDVCSMGSSIGTTRIYTLNMHYGTYSSVNSKDDDGNLLPYRSVNDLILDDLAIYVGNDKKINLLGGPGDSIGSIHTGVINTRGSTTPKKEYDYLHED